MVEVPVKKFKFPIPQYVPKFCKKCGTELNDIDLDFMADNFYNLFCCKNCDEKKPRINKNYVAEFAKKSGIDFKVLETFFSSVVFHPTKFNIFSTEYGNDILKILIDSRKDFLIFSEKEKKSFETEKKFIIVPDWKSDATATKKIHELAEKNKNAVFVFITTATLKNDCRYMNCEHCKKICIDMEKIFPEKNAVGYTL